MASRCPPLTPVCRYAARHTISSTRDQHRLPGLQVRGMADGGARAKVAVVQFSNDVRVEQVRSPSNINVCPVARACSVCNAWLLWYVRVLCVTHWVGCVEELCHEARVEQAR